MAKASIVLAINGNNQITNQLYSESFDVNKKMEYEFSGMTVLDGYTALSISRILPFSKLIATSDGQLKIKILTTTSESENVISGTTYLSFDPTYASTISGVALGTDSTTSVTGSVTLINLV